MNVLSFAFNTINASKKEKPNSKIGIANSMNIDKVEDAKVSVDKANSTIRISFTHTSEYTPDFAKITLKGQMILLVEAAQAKKIMDGWKKDKRLEKEAGTFVINSLTSRCSVQAVITSRDLALPPPIPLPRVGTRPAAKK